MTGLIIFLSILALIILILITPIGLNIFYRYESIMYVKLRYLVFSYTLYPAKKKKKAKKKDEKKPDIISSTIKEKGLLEAIRQVAELLKLVMETAGKVLRHTVISKLNVRIVSASDDAAKTAIEYGSVCAGVYTLIAALQNAMKIRRHNIDIKPDFDKQKPEIEVDITVRILIIFVVTALISALFKYMKTQKSTENPKQKKGMSENERSSD